MKPSLRVAMLAGMIVTAAWLLAVVFILMATHT